MTHGESDFGMLGGKLSKLKLKLLSEYCAD